MDVVLDFGSMLVDYLASLGYSELNLILFNIDVIMVEAVSSGTIPINLVNKVPKAPKLLSRGLTFEVKLFKTSNSGSHQKVKAASHAH